MKEPIHAARQFLWQAQLGDGSWPYYLTSAQGSPEPTCYSLLALGDGRDDPAWQRALAWLKGRVNGDGAVTLAGDDEPHWSTSHLVLALAHLGQEEALRERSAAFLLAWQPGSAESVQDVPEEGNLIGWPWIGQTFSWVEPTCYALIALKRAGVGPHPRLAAAESVLFDRVCAGGGWNVGNPVILGRPLEAFLPTTALALLALQDVDTAGEAIEQGLAFLRDETNRGNYSTLSLALTILCLAAYGEPTGSFVELLLERQLADGSWRQMTQLTALSVLALQSVNGSENVFKL